MFNGRIYWVAWLLPLLALVVAAFSFSARPVPLGSNLAPDAFDGALVAEELARLSREFPDRRPGSSGDDRLALRVAQDIQRLGSLSGGGFQVSVRRFGAQTIDGERTLTDVIAQRPGSTGASPIVILAHRDADGASSRAELSATAVLLELARVFSSRETRRTIILVSTSGGSGGDGGAADFAAHAPAPIDAAIVLGDLASREAHRPFVVPYSDGLGGAPERLTRTVQSSIAQEAGVQPGESGIFGQFAHLAFPMAVGEQGPLDARGIPAVLVQVSGPRGPSPRAAIAPQRIESFGRAVLNAVDALDEAPDISPGPEAVLVLHGDLVPGWALRLLGGALMLPVLLLAIDALARVRRRREPVARWGVWAISLGSPPLLCSLLVAALAATGAIGASPAGPVSARAIPVDSSARAAIAAVLLAFFGIWWGRARLIDRLGAIGRPATPAAGLAVLLVLLAMTVLVWLFNPLAALLLVPALHLLPLVLDPELRPRRALGLPVVALSLLPAIALFVFYAHELGAGPLGVAWMVLLLLAGGHLGLIGAALASVILGCLLGALLIALQGDERTGDPSASRIGTSIYAASPALSERESALRS